MATITYETNFLGFKGPRRITTILSIMTDVENKNEDADDFSQEEESLIKQYRSSNLELQSKSPVWSNDTQSYFLNFHGRVTQASVKNFQLIHKTNPDHTILQFGKVGEDVFTLDFGYPMCALQAFGIALSSIDGKLACE